MDGFPADAESDIFTTTEATTTLPTTTTEVVTTTRSPTSGVQLDISGKSFGTFLMSDKLSIKYIDIYSKYMLTMSERQVGKIIPVLLEIELFLKNIRSKISKTDFCTK